MRTSSMTVERPRNSMSVSSGDSGVMVGGDEIVRRFDVSGRQSAGEPRVGSNSFDSAVSMDSFSARKVTPLSSSPTVPSSTSPALRQSVSAKNEIYLVSLFPVFCLRSAMWTWVRPYRSPRVYHLSPLCCLKTRSHLLAVLPTFTRTSITWVRMGKKITPSSDIDLFGPFQY